METFFMICLSIAGLITFALIFMFGCGIGAFGKWGQLTFGHIYKYNGGADKLLEDLLDKVKDGKISAKILDEFVIQLGDHQIWIENKYYGYANRIGKDGDYRNLYNEVRVSYKQAKRLISLEDYIKINGPILAEE